MLVARIDSGLGDESNIEIQRADFGSAVFYDLYLADPVFGKSQINAVPLTSIVEATTMANRWLADTVDLL